MIYQVRKNREVWTVEPCSQWPDDPDICLRLHKIDSDRCYCYVCFPGITKKDIDHFTVSALLKGMQFIREELATSFWRDELGKVRL